MSVSSISAMIQRVMPLVIASGLCKSLCTIQQPSGTLDTMGSPDRVYVNVAGLVNLTCMAAPLNVGTPSVSETKTMSEVLACNNGHVFLPSYHPEIVDGYKAGWRAIIDGIAYDILGAENDSQATQTRMKVEISSV